MAAHLTIVALSSLTLGKLGMEALGKTPALTRWPGPGRSTADHEQIMNIDLELLLQAAERKLGLMGVFEIVQKGIYD